MRRGGIACLAFATVLLAATPAGATVTIGSNLANPANDNGPCNATACTITNLSLSSDVAPDGLRSPVNGTVTSWRFVAEFGGHTIDLRILREAGGVAMTGSGTSSSVTSVVGLNGPFATSLPISAGDHIGLDAPGPTFGEGLLSDAASGTLLDWTMPILADGSTRDGSVYPLMREVLVQATVEPSNTVSFGTVVLNKKKGTASLSVHVPNAGALTYDGAGVSVTGGPASVSAASDITLTIRATGKKRKKLNQKGKVAVTPTVTFTPTSGTAKTQSKILTLRKNRKK